MPYSFTNSKGTTYYLHAKQSASETGKQRTLFYFSKELREDSLSDVPNGYEVVEIETGLPVLKRLAGDSTTDAPPPPPKK